MVRESIGYPALGPVHDQIRDEKKGRGHCGDWAKEVQKPESVATQESNLSYRSNKKKILLIQGGGYGKEKIMNGRSEGIATLL